MNPIINQPENINFLSPLGFKFHVEKMPTANFFVQKVRVPSVHLAPAQQPTPFSTMPFPGDHLTYDRLHVTFKLDEALMTYTDIYGWMEALGFPQSYQQYKDGTKPDNVTAGALDTVSDASLLVLSSAMNPIFQYKFKNLFPTAIGAFSFDTTDPNVTYINVEVEFIFGFMTVTRDTSDFGG